MALTDYYNLHFRKTIHNQQEQKIVRKQKLEFNQKNAMLKMVSLYSKTYKEKGHLRRLIGILDDDDHKIQKNGIDALIDVLKDFFTLSEREN